MSVVAEVRAGTAVAPGADSRGAPVSDRPVYTLSVAAELLGTLPRVLMAYEEYGLVVPTRTKTNRRRYSQLDVDRLQMVHFLHTKKGVNLVGIRLVLELLDELRRRGADVERMLSMS